MYVKYVFNGLPGVQLSSSVTCNHFVYQHVNITSSFQPMADLQLAGIKPFLCIRRLFLCNRHHIVEQEEHTLPPISDRFLHKLTWIAYIKPAFFSPSVAFVILKVQMHLSHFPLLFHILKIPGFKDTMSACGRFMTELSKRCWRITLSITPRTLKAFSSSAGLLRFQEGLELSAPGG